MPPKAIDHPVTPLLSIYSTISRKVVARANHFLVGVANKGLYHFKVSITLEVPSRENHV